MVHDVLALGPSLLPPGTNDARLIELWLDGRPETTGEEYWRDVRQFLAFLGGKPLAQVHLGDLHAYRHALEEAALAPASVARKLHTLKSLFSFAQSMGYLPLNVGRALTVRKGRSRLAERILTREQVLRLLVKAEGHPRNYAIVRLLYATGIRVSECCGLEWRDVIERMDGGQITVLGKGGSERAIPISLDTLAALVRQSSERRPSSPVFSSRGGGAGRGGSPLSRSQVWTIVEQAAVAADLHVFTTTVTRKRYLQRDRQRIYVGEEEVRVSRSLVSPHWLRHACASHLLDEGAPIQFVKAVLGHEDIETTAGYSHARPGMSPAPFLKV